MRGKPSPVSFLLLIGILAVAVNVLRGRVPMFADSEGAGVDAASDCPAGDPSFCDEGVLAGPNAARVVLQAGEACRDVGYLCTELEESGSQRAYRWPDGTTRLRIRIPPPPGRDQSQIKGPPTRRRPWLPVLESQALRVGHRLSHDVGGTRRHHGLVEHGSLRNPTRRNGHRMAIRIRGAALPGAQAGVGLPKSVELQTGPDTTAGAPDRSS